MNVFILCTGRCGSQSFAQAASHITNFTSAHESQKWLLGDSRIRYPAWHIEVDNRLSWFLGRMDQMYGDRATYVHLIRDAEETARSYNRRWQIAVGIIPAYYRGILMQKEKPKDSLAICREFVQTVNNNIELFLKDKTRKMVFNLENAAADFEEFWDLINAEGNKHKAIQEWMVRYDQR